MLQAQLNYKICWEILAGEARGHTDVDSLVLSTDEGDDQSGNVGPDHLAGAGAGDLVPGEAGWRIS